MLLLRCVASNILFLWGRDHLTVKIPSPAPGTLQKRPPSRLDPFGGWGMDQRKIPPREGSTGEGSTTLAKGSQDYLPLRSLPPPLPRRPAPDGAAAPRSDPTSRLGKPPAKPRPPFPGWNAETMLQKGQATPSSEIPAKPRPRLFSKPTPDIK